MVIFCSFGVVEEVKKYRFKLGLADKTVVLSLKLNKTPYYYLKPLISQCFEESRTSYLLDPKSFSHRALLLIFYNKIKVLEYTSEQNYFNSECFLWLDFAIFSDPSRHDKFVTVERITDTLPGDKIKMCLLEDSSIKEISNRERFYKTKRWKAIGGNISVPKIHMKTFVSIWNQELRKSLEVGIPAFEEQILSCVKAIKSDIFDCYYGDYKDIFKGYYNYHSHGYIAFQNLRHCRQNSIWDTVIKVGSKILIAIDNGKLNWSPEMLVDIYNEIVIGAWYGNDKTLSWDAAIRITKLIDKISIGSQKKRNILQNLTCHDIHHPFNK